VSSLLSLAGIRIFVADRMFIFLCSVNFLILVFTGGAVALA
jgi:hypothetical protein